MLQYNQSLRYRLDPNIFYTYLNEQSVVLGNNTNEFFGLNVSATLLLKRLELGSSSISELSDYLLETFDGLNYEQSMHDVNQFIIECCQYQWIVEDKSLYGQHL